MADAASSVLVGAVEGTQLTEDEKVFFRDEQLAGVTLFRRNIPTDYANSKELVSLVDELRSFRAAGAPPLVIAIDQEGGRVSRFAAPFPNLGPALNLAGGRFDRAAIDEITEYAGEVADELLRYGINVNFAPVCDVLTEATNTGIGDRVFGTTPQVATPRAGAFLAGLERRGVRGCLKHFPGQGAAKVDTHFGQAVINRSFAELRECELKVFEALVHQTSMVMIAHCIYPQLAAKEAGRSQEIIGDLLRGRMGFKGVVVSDDMNMGALPQQISSWQEILIESIYAGIDMLLVCRDLTRCQAALAALRAEEQKSPVFAKRLKDAAGRVTAMRQSLR